MISQKTVGKLDAVLRRLFFFRPSERILPLWTWLGFRAAMYEREFDIHFLKYLEREYGGKPSLFLPLIYDGTIHAFVYRNDGSGQPTPNEDDRKNGQQTLCVMIEVVISYSQKIQDHVERPTPRELSAEVIASLRKDGLDFIGGKVVPAEMKSVNLKKEDEYLIGLIRAIGPPNMAEIQHHHDESDKARGRTGR